MTTKEREYNDKYIAALRAFENAAYHLLDVWVEGDELFESDTYPFSQSFDDVCLDIRNWRESVVTIFGKYGAGQKGSDIIVVWDRETMDETNDYKTVAHIYPNGNVRYISDDSQELKLFVEQVKRTM